MYRIGVGKVQDYGLPEPDHKIGEAHPTISADFLNRIAHGEMTWKPNVPCCRAIGSASTTAASSRSM